MVVFKSTVAQSSPHGSLFALRVGGFGLRLTFSVELLKMTDPAAKPSVLPDERFARRERLLHFRLERPLLTFSLSFGPRTLLLRPLAAVAVESLGRAGQDFGISGLPLAQPQLAVFLLRPNNPLRLDDAEEARFSPALHVPHRRGEGLAAIQVTYRYPPFPASLFNGEKPVGHGSNCFKSRNDIPVNLTKAALYAFFGHAMPSP